MLGYSAVSKDRERQQIYIYYTIKWVSLLRAIGKMSRVAWKYFFFSGKITLNNNSHLLQHNIPNKLFMCALITKENVLSSQWNKKVFYTDSKASIESRFSDMQWRFIPKTRRTLANARSPYNRRQVLGTFRSLFEEHRNRPGYINALVITGTHACSLLQNVVFYQHCP